ncbi:helix-turn-helix domain-containing protein [Haloarchaeobius iranensis]|uniref:HTH DNA binding domain-containing protein n=1 Tax=Haloarchaeobius iranensis TaxID=996166 RepID=A0A1G9YR93_9EURY|nr:helix-turn-helix domain-containing protein [Haloarchaeobius iranensis]SDN11125.1 HTH DNA binding domain-containing protein [Haloarchaeobius iranensis]
MGLVAEFEITCEVLPFVSVIDDLSCDGIDLEMQLNHGDTPIFLAYVTGAAVTEADAAFDRASFVGQSTLVGRAGDTLRYQVVPSVGMDAHMGEEIDDLDGLRGLAEAAAIIDHIEVTPTGWVQSGWFADRAAFDEFRRFWQDEGEFTLRRLTRDGEPEPPGDGLTDPQREALRTAYEMGYFDVPRGASLDNVAAELGIGASAASERLRRAQTHLVETTVASTWPPLPD